ncbi:hypothetical protein Hanom_Chr09g00819121 [Helianthus anomalus]
MEPIHQEDDSSSPSSPTWGVKEDLSEITKTLTRQLWGIASFLAPPPPSDPINHQSDPSDLEDAAPEGILGIRRDFAKNGGRFRSGISKLSNNIDVLETRCYRLLCRNFDQGFGQVDIVYFIFFFRWNQGFEMMKYIYKIQSDCIKIQA